MNVNSTINDLVCPRTVCRRFLSLNIQRKNGKINFVKKNTTYYKMSDAGMAHTLKLLRRQKRQDDSKASGSSRRSQSRSRSHSRSRSLSYIRTPRLTVPQQEEVGNVLVNAAHGRVNRVKVGVAVAAGVVLSALGAIAAVWSSLPKAAQEGLYHNATKFFNISDIAHPTRPGFKSVKKTQKSRTRTRKVSQKVSKKSRKVSHKKSPKKH